MQIPRKAPGVEDFPTPERILSVTTGAWTAGILGASVTHGIFTHVQQGACTTDEIARRAGLSIRGAQSLLDGLVGLGFLRNNHGDYVNTPESSAFLVEGRPGYLGHYIRLEGLAMEQWMSLPDAVRAEAPPPGRMPNENRFWEELAQALVPISFPVAQEAVKHLGLAEAGPVSILDVGGGSGIFSAVFLFANPEARSIQVDRSSVNRIARDVVASYGVEPGRFTTVDGDYHNIDFGSEKHDVVVYSHIAHGESPEENRNNFQRINSALKPGGTITVVDFVLEDNRTGHPFAMIFNANMFMRTMSGGTYTRAQYRDWLESAGFRRVRYLPTEGPATMVMADA